MADETGSPRFMLIRLDQHTWVIRNQDLTPDAQVVARIHLTTDPDLEVDTVSWAPPVSLSARYATAEHALADLELSTQRPKGATKPIPIPHFPPAQP